VDHQEKEAESCSIPDEIIDVWLGTIEERKRRMEAKGHTRSEQYERLLGLQKRVRQIKAARQRKCRIPKVE